ncbi:MAG: GIY-YIG nuclease family protein [Bacteroidales bacterium]|nr:GIY-YIG nuclease family protein [Bacteroidales bacterium]
MKQPATYIVTNKADGVLYVGVTSNLKSRIAKHKNKTYKDSFTARYNVDKLVWFQELPIMHEAIAREKQLKAGSRAKKVKLIVEMNPEWRDLFEDL